MSAPSKEKATSRPKGAAARRPRADDPRVLRSRTAAVDAARTLFLQKGYAGTTMEEIASLAGLTRRTLYNNFADKEALFLQVVTDVIAYAEEFVRRLHEEFTVGVDAENLPARLEELGRRLALGVVRPEVVALRRLLIGEAREFPELAKEYFERAPRQVIEALAAGFRYLDGKGLLRVEDAACAAAQFGYLVAGEYLDRAMLAGAIAPPEQVAARAREGVVTFLARYGAAAG